MKKMTLREKFTQEHVATIQLSESAQIGEFGSSEETKVTPGTYNVYKVTKNDEGYYGLMYAQDGDFYTNIEEMDMVDIRGVDAGTYGIASNQGEYDTCSVDVYVRDNGGCSPTAYVAQTNSGDGAFAVFTNSDNTAFFLDDENIYLNYLIEERHPEDAADIIGVFDGFEYEPENKEITAYFFGLDIPEYTTTVSEDKRNIDTLAEVYVSVYECEKMKQEGAEDKRVPQETEMQGFTQINLRDESIDYIERKDLDSVVVDAASNFAEVSYDGNDHYMCSEYRVGRGREDYTITQEDSYTEEGHPLYTVTHYYKGGYDDFTGRTLGEAFLEATGVTEDHIEPYVCCKDGFKPIDGAINLRYACEYDRRGNVTFAPKFKDKTDNILINAQLTRDGWNGVVAVGYNFKSQGETEIFEEVKFHNMRTQEVLDVVDKLQFEHMGTHINQEPDWSFAKEDNLER